MTKHKNTAEWTRQYLLHSKGFNPARQLREYVLFRAIRSFGLRPSMSLLDVGCGGGAFLTRLIDAGFDNVQGIEPNDTLRTDAVTRDPKLVGRIQDGIAEDIPFPDNSFDAVYCFNVLHHLDCLEAFARAFNEFDRVLRPGGVFVLVEPARPWVYTTLRLGFRLFAPMLPQARRLHGFMDEEREQLAHFFRHRGFFSKRAIELGYVVLDNANIAHQCIFAARKS